MDNNFHMIDDTEVYIIDSENLPELPIRWVSDKERMYAQAITHNILNGTFKAPGKYGIEIENSPLWNDRLDVTVYEIEED